MAVTSASYSAKPTLSGYSICHLAITSAIIILIELEHETWLAYHLPHVTLCQEHLPPCSIKGYKIYLCGFTIYHISNANNICQGIPSTLQTYGIISAMVLVNLQHSAHKNCRAHQHSYTIKHWKIIKIDIFLRPEEAMFGNWQMLVF